MAESAENDYNLILEKVPEEDQPAVALFLSGCFSLPPASTRGIAASAPVALLSGMTRPHAEAVLAELKPFLPEGAVLRVADREETGKASRLQWPRPPRIYGKELAEFVPASGEHELTCPLCGGAVKVYMDSGTMRAKIAAKAGETGSHPLGRASTANDKDPLFSGIKPLAAASSDFASIRSLEAGDTGFWMDYSRDRERPPIYAEAARAGESAHAGRSPGKQPAGLSAFMRPGVFAVVVGRTRDPQVVKIIAEVMGVSEEEARDRCLSLGLCVARDISLDEAQNLLSRFRTLGARARIAKPM